MKIEVNGSLEMKSTDLILKESGCGYMGKVQKVVDTECTRRMGKYTPRITGFLEGQVLNETKVGSGEIRQTTPYARYLYYGKLMVSSITGSSYASKREKKVLTDQDLKYTKSFNRLAGSFWFKRMVDAEKEEILRAAQKEIDGKS